MTVAFCKICGKDVLVQRGQVTPAKTKAKLWILKLECGHFFNWETGNCHTEEDFPIPNLSRESMLKESAEK